MNILYIFNAPIVASAGGVQRVTEVLTKEWLRRGHRVTFLAYRYPEWMEGRIFIAPQYYIAIDGRSASDIRAEVNQLIEANGIEYVINQLTDADMTQYLPDNVKKICVCHVQPYNMDGIRRSRIWSSKAKNFRQHLFRLAGLAFPQIPERFFARVANRAFRAAYPLVDKVCFISERFYPRLLHHVPEFPREKLCAVYNPNTFDVDTITLNGKRENVVLFVGRIENAQKNVIGFIKMWQIFSRNNPSWRAEVIGEGSDLPYMKRYVERHAIPRINFLGRRDDVARFYEKARFLAVTSFGESWGMVVTEAMAYGCVPCVFDTYETLHDIVDDGQNGLIVPPSPQVMAERLQKVADDPAAWKGLSENAHEKVRAFAVDKIVDQWEELLKTL